MILDFVAYNNGNDCYYIKYRFIARHLPIIIFELII
jgi:hypothetical protein